MKVTFFVLGGVAIVMILVLGSSAFSAPLRWGSSVSVTQEYDDNVFLSRADRTSDFITRLAPQFRVSSDADKMQWLIRYAPLSDWHVRRKELNTIKHFLDLGWSVPVTQGGVLSLSDHFGFTPDSTEISSVGVAVPRGDLYSNTAALQFQSSRLSLSYSNGFQAFKSAQLRDGLSHTVHEQAALPLSNRYQLTQSYRMRYFLLDGEDNFRSHALGAGLKFQASRTFSMGAEAGGSYWRASTDDSFRTSGMYQVDLDQKFKDFSLGLSYLKDIRTQLRAKAGYRLRKGSVGASFSRDLAAGGGALGNTVDRQSADLRWTQSVGRRANLFLAAGYSTHKSISGAQSAFKAYRGSAGLTGTIRPWLNASMRYQYFKQLVSGGQVSPAAEEFTRNQGIFSLTAVMP